MSGTLLFVRMLKSAPAPEYAGDDVLYMAELKGKKAVTVTTSLSEIPLEFVFPGTRVDVVNKTGTEVYNVANGVYVLGITILDEDSLARVVLAVDDAQSEALLKNRQGVLSFIVHSNHDASGSERIEIIEF